MEKKTIQVAKILGNGSWRVIYNVKKAKFAVNWTYFDPFTGKNRTKKVAEYGTRRDCLHYIADRIER